MFTINNMIGITERRRRRRSKRRTRRRRREKKKDPEAGECGVNKDQTAANIA